MKRTLTCQLAIALLLSGAAMLLLTSCTTAGKATSYFDAHRDTAAGYCATRYPVIENSATTVSVDSAGMKKAIINLLSYSDSLLNAVENKNDAIDQVNDLLSLSKSQNEYNEQLVDSLQAKMSRIKKTDTAALRQSISSELKKRIQPCHDTTIVKTVENTARLEQQKIRADKFQSTANEYTSGRNSPATVFGWLMRALARKWWFWLVVAIVVGYFTRNIWKPKIPFLN